MEKKKGFCLECGAKGLFPVVVIPHMERFRGLDIEIEWKRLKCSSCHEFVPNDELLDEGLDDLYRIYEEKTGISARFQKKVN